MTLIFVTGNRHKFKEASELASKYGLELEMRDVGYEEIQADELEEIARRGAEKASALLGKPCFVEDAGLFIRSLRGFPGPYSSYVFRTIGNEGLLRLMGGVGDRRAEFRSVVAYCEPSSRTMSFRGKVQGTIALEARGSRGFGFDPIFIPQGADGRTFAEMTVDEKNRFSHRAKAIEGLLKWYLRKFECHLEK